MAWCIVCNENREIDHCVRGDSKAVPTVSERYNREGKYIGYDVGGTYKTTLESVPACKWCGTRFEVPMAQSKEQYFYAKKDLCIKRWQGSIDTSYKSEFKAEEGTKGPMLVISLIAGIPAALGIHKLTGNTVLAAVLGLAIVLGVAYLVYRLLYSKKKKEIYEAERRYSKRKIADLQAMEFSEDNYQSVKDM